MNNPDDSVQYYTLDFFQIAVSQSMFFCFFFNIHINVHTAVILSGMLDSRSISALRGKLNDSKPSIKRKAASCRSFRGYSRSWYAQLFLCVSKSPIRTEDLRDQMFDSTTINAFLDAADISWESATSAISQFYLDDECQGSAYYISANCYLLFAGYLQSKVSE